MQATALGEAQGRLRIARNHTAEDYNMLKLTMEARRHDLLQILSSEHKAYTKATQARAEVQLSISDDPCCALPQLSSLVAASSGPAASAGRLRIGRACKQAARHQCCRWAVSNVCPHTLQAACRVYTCDTASRSRRS